MFKITPEILGARLKMIREDVVRLTMTEIAGKINSTINASGISRLERGHNVGSVQLSELLSFYSEYVYIDNLFKEDFCLIETTGKETAVKSPINSVAVKAIDTAKENFTAALGRITQELFDNLDKSASLIK